MSANTVSDTVTAVNIGELLVVVTKANSPPSRKWRGKDRQDSISD